MMTRTVAMTGPEWAWGGGTGRGVRVAVVDSGVEAGHRLVGDVAGYVAFESDPADEHAVRTVHGPHEDLVGHGTACAGLVRAIAPDAQLFSVRVLGSNLKGRAAVFAAGLRWAIDNDMQVINLSLSTSNRDYFALFHELVDLAYFRGAVVVSAMNNVPRPSFPSEYASVISVGANDRTGDHCIDYRTARPPEFLAPGVHVEVAWRGGGTAHVTGNSYAAAHVSGLAARILGKHGDLRPFEVKTILRSVATDGVP